MKNVPNIYAARSKKMHSKELESLITKINKKSKLDPISKFISQSSEFPGPGSYSPKAKKV